MISVDFTQNEFYPHWAARQLDISRGYFGDCSTIAIYGDIGLIAVAVYSAFTENNVELSLASKNKWWAKPDIIDLLINDYPFKQMGCRRITLLIREDGKHVRRLVEKIGFKHEGTIREMHKDGTNMVVYGILRSEVDNGKQVRQKIPSR